LTNLVLENALAQVILMLDTHLTDFMTLVDFSRVIWETVASVSGSVRVAPYESRLHVRNQKKLVGAAPLL